MGEILNELLDGVKKREIDEQVKIICDQITKEERPDGDETYNGPLGSNIFLSLHISDEQTKRGGLTIITEKYLVLEREAPEVYILSLWNRVLSTGKPQVLKKVKTYPVKESKAEKILKFYAEIMKFEKGE